MRISATVRGITIHRKGYREHWSIKNSFWNVVFCGIATFLKTFFKEKTTTEKLIEKNLQKQMKEQQ